MKSRKVITLKTKGPHSEVITKHISDYPPEEQQRMLNLTDPNRLEKRRGFIIPDHQKGGGTYGKKNKSIRTGTI